MIVTNTVINYKLTSHVIKKRTNNKISFIEFNPAFSCHTNKPVDNNGSVVKLRQISRQPCRCVHELTAPSSEC